MTVELLAAEEGATYRPGQRLAGVQIARLCIMFPSFGSLLLVGETNNDQDSASKFQFLVYHFRVMEITARPQRSSDRVRSVDRAFTLLERLTDAGGPLTLSELAELVQLPVPTVYRLLRFLLSQGYVRLEPSKRYALGLRMIRFGQAASRGLDSWATPHLTSLVEKFGETANMAVMEGDSCIYVAQVPSPQSMRMFTEVGRVVLPHCTGVGKAIMSMLDDQQVTGLLQRTGMPARTEHTLTSVDAMLSALAQARKLGYALDDGEQELGVRCVAVPLVGLPFLAAISVSGPGGRVTMADVSRIAPELQAVADDIARTYQAGEAPNPLRAVSMQSAS